MDQLLSTFFAQLLSPGFAAGVLIGLGGAGVAVHKNWFTSSVNAKMIADMKAENARLTQALDSALKRVEQLAAELEPWRDFRDQLVKAALTERETPNA